MTVAVSAIQGLDELFLALNSELASHKPEIIADARNAYATGTIVPRTVESELEQRYGIAVNHYGGELGDKQKLPFWMPEDVFLYTPESLQVKFRQRAYPDGASLLDAVGFIEKLGGRTYVSGSTEPLGGDRYAHMTFVVPARGRLFGLLPAGLTYAARHANLRTDGQMNYSSQRVGIVDVNICERHPGPDSTAEVEVKVRDIPYQKVQQTLHLIGELLGYSPSEAVPERLLRVS